MSPAGAAAHALPVTTGFDLPGYRVTEGRGACFGLVVRSMGFAKGFAAPSRRCARALDTPARGRRGRRRRHGEDGEVRPHWVATDEVFRDPVSGRVMRVWIDPTDASRHYAPVQQ
jgi:hypothetical protein